MKIRWTARSVGVQVPPPAPTALYPRFEVERLRVHQTRRRLDSRETTLFMMSVCFAPESSFLLVSKLSLPCFHLRKTVESLMQVSPAQIGRLWVASSELRHRTAGRTRRSTAASRRTSSHRHQRCGRWEFR